MTMHEHGNDNDNGNSMVYRYEALAASDNEYQRYGIPFVTIHPTNPNFIILSDYLYSLIYPHFSSSICISRII